MMIASYHRIFKIALPIMLSNAMLPLVGMVDAAVIGRMGAVAPLAAVGMGGMFIAMMFWLFNFFDITTTAAVGKARGSGDFSQVERHIRRSIVLALILATLIVVLIPFWQWILPFLFSSSGEVTPFLQSYVGIRLLGTPAAFLMHILSGYLLGYERTRTLLFIELAMQLINLALDVVFVIGFGWGVKGVAMASVIAEYSWLLIAMMVLKSDILPILSRFPRSLKTGEGLRAFLENNGYLFIRALGLHLVVLLFYRASGGLGDELIAINTVLMIFVTFAAQATDGFAVAIEVLVAQAIGQKNVEAMRVNIWRSSLVSLVLALLVILALALYGDTLFNWVSTNAALRDLAPRYLPWVMAAILVGVFAWSLDGIFFGAAKGRDMMISMLFTLAGYVILLMVLVPRFGNDGLWIAFTASYALRAIGLAYFYPRVEAEARI